MAERTHADLKVGVPYPNQNGYTDITYILKKVQKGQTPNLPESKIQLPKALSVICGLNCALLKGKDTCPTHEKAGLVTIPSYPGSEPSMLSFVVARITVYIAEKNAPTIWSASLDQVTSRSINHAIDVERARTWDESPAEVKNALLDSIHGAVWQVLAAPEGKSSQLKAVAQNAEKRAQKLFKQLLEELATKYGDARWTNGRGVDSAIVLFENPHTFMAGLTGANTQYSSYATHTPQQLAMLHELALREGRKVNPALVKEIMGCYAKVREAEKYEIKPYIWDQKIVEKVMLSRKFKTQPEEVLLPF